LQAFSPPASSPSFQHVCALSNRDRGEERRAEEGGRKGGTNFLLAAKLGTISSITPMPSCLRQDCTGTSFHLVGGQTFVLLPFLLPSPHTFLHALPTHTCCTPLHTPPHFHKALCHTAPHTPTTHPTRLPHLPHTRTLPHLSTPPHTCHGLASTANVNLPPTPPTTHRVCRCTTTTPASAAPRSARDRLDKFAGRGDYRQTTATHATYTPNTLLPGDIFSCNRTASPTVPLYYLPPPPLLPCQRPSPQDYHGQDHYCAQVGKGCLAALLPPAALPSVALHAARTHAGFTATLRPAHTTLSAPRLPLSAPPLLFRHAAWHRAW